VTREYIERGRQASFVDDPGERKIILFSQIVCEVEVGGLDTNVVLALDSKDTFN